MAIEVTFKHHEPTQTISREPANITELWALTAQLSFRTFTPGDWMSFQGCESGNPLIAEGFMPGGEFYLILDGDQAEFGFDTLRPSPDTQVRINFDLKAGTFLRTPCA